MGYDVHITRKTDWADQGGPEILLAEWLDALKLDPEMRLHAFAESSVDGAILRVEDPGLAVWTRYSGDAADSKHAWFHWRRGEIVVKNPDEEILRKMHSVGKALGAAVQGDDGELYDAQGRTLSSNAPDGKSHPKPWWRFW